MSTPSSSSKLAWSTPLFDAWKIRAKIVVIKDPPANVKAHFDHLYRLEEVPRVLVEGPLPSPTYDAGADFQHTVRSWASTLPLTNEDEYGILAVLNILAFAYNRIRKTSNNQSKEHDQRRGIDDIIEIGFSAKTDRHCNFTTEDSYHLVELNGNPDAQSDTLVTIPSNRINDKLRNGRLFFTDPNTIDNLYWSTSGVSDDFSIIGFAGEFKRDDAAYNENRLIMVLTTAQSQRKALSLKNSIIMGATRCRGQVHIYSSYWNSDGSTLYIHAHDQGFDLTNPVEVIRLYIFCSKLEKYIQDTLTSELQEWNTLDEMTVKNLMWRSPARKRRRTEAGSTARSGNNDRGGDDDSVDVDGFDNDQVMEVMKWRDGLVEDGMETRTISGEGENS